MRAVIVWLTGAALVGCNLAPNPEADKAAQREREERIATLINLNGELCARVVFVSPQLSSGEYQVNCDEYREPQKAQTKNNLVVYMVNLDTGTVRRMGRG